MKKQSLKLLMIVSILLMTCVTFAQDPSPDDWANSGTESIKTDKKIGIGLGTATPSHMLDIFTGGANVKTYAYGLETTVNSSGGWARSIRLRNEYDNAVTAFGSLHGEAYISTGFDINTDPTGYLTPKFFIKSNGNVGIGTTNPSSYTKLDIEGNKLMIRSTSSDWGQFQVANPIDSESTIAIAAGGSGSPGNDTTYTRQWIMGINPYGVGVDRFAITNKGLTTSAPFVILEAGNVGIGTTTPTGGKLVVNGTIRAKEVKVETNWSDFVFEDNYNLPPLDKVESFIKENRHLPDTPSAKQVEAEGVSVAQMIAKQMQKIEELTLYVIEQNKQISALKTELSELKKNK
jgi:hypothetical protein